MFIAAFAGMTFAQKYPVAIEARQMAVFQISLLQEAKHSL
jgi:hypothetical protein